MQTAHDIQRQQQAGHTKLTAVRILFRGRQHQFFAPLVHNQQGEAILPVQTLDRWLDQLGVRRGDTYSVS